MKIEVVDEIMGSGKSHTTLRYIENLALNNNTERWIFCTEYLSEIEQRTQENPLAAHLWRTPMNTGDDTKTTNLKELLTEPDVQLIGITHALLLSASKDSYVNYLIKERGYNLFLDETVDLITEYNGVKFGDFLKALYREELSICDPYGRVKWLAKDEKDITLGYDTSTDRLKVDSARGVIFCAVRPGSSVSENDSVSIVEIANEVILKQFKRVIIATYQLDNTLFDAYLSVKGIEKVVCADVVCGRNTTKKSIAEKIEFVSKYDRPFAGEYKLSSNWYKGKSTAEDFKLLNKTIKAIGDKNGCKGNAHMLGFTVPADRLGKQRDPKKVQPVGYPHTVCSVVVDAKGNEREEHSKSLSTYVPCNARASNEYANKVVMIHAYNRYPITPVLNYLTYHKVKFSSERFALNEIVQWVWRSAIRNGENIKLAILSSRMRELFKTWLKD